MTSRRRKLAVSACAVSAALFVLSAVTVFLGARSTGAATTRAMLVAIREATFSKFVETDEVFRATPADLIGKGFLVDEAPFRIEGADTQGIVRPIQARPQSDADAVTQLRALLANVPWQNSPACAPGASLSEKARLLREGRTCCSDNVELLLAQAALEGNFVREVHTSRHVMAEFFLASENRWVFFDPSYGIIARDPAGRALGFREIRSALLERKNVHFEFLGTSIGQAELTSPSQLEYYDSPEDFETASVVLGNNVFAVDQFRHSLRVLPESVRQGVGLLVGVYPRVAILIDPHAQWASLVFGLRLRLVLMLVAAMALIASALWLRRSRRAP